FAHGGTQLRAHRVRIREAHPHSGGVSEHPLGIEDRLGVRVAHADRGGARVRHDVGLGRARLVHLREQERARHPGGVRGPVHRDPHRAPGGEPDLPDDRLAHRAPMGDALLSGAPHAAPGARFSGMLLVAVWIGELARIVHPFAGLALASALALGAFVALAWLRASRHIRALFLAVIAVAGGVPHALAQGYERSQIFGAFLPSVLFLRATAEESPRIERLRHGLGALAPQAAQNWTLFGSHALGAVLSVGAMSVVAPVVSRGADDARRTGLATSSARGVGAAVMWSPFFVAMGFTSQLVPHVAIGALIAIGAGLGAIGLGLSLAMYTPRLTRAAFVASLAQLKPLLFPMAIVIAAVVGASAAFGLPGLSSVSLVVPLCCLAYLALLGASAARSAARR